MRPRPSPPAPPVPSLSPVEAQGLLTSGRDDVLLLDVREPEEQALAGVAGALCIPMELLWGRLAEIPREKQVLVLCHHGIRSWHVAHALLAHGWPRVANVAGGIDRWSAEADPSIPRYE